MADDFSCRFAAEAARVPQLESDLRAARAQCAESEEAGRAAAAKLKVADGELTRLRRLEANHLKELAALKKDGEEKLEGLSKRLEEVERQRLALREEVNSKSKELSATAKRWVDEISALDRGLAGESYFSFLPLCRLSAVGCRLRLAADGRTLIFSISPSSGWGQSVLAGYRQVFFKALESPSSGWGQSDLAGCRQAYFRTSEICIFQLFPALIDF
jgi:hypothetical protein